MKNSKDQREEFQKVNFLIEKSQGNKAELVKSGSENDLVQKVFTIRNFLSTSPITPADFEIFLYYTLASTDFDPELSSTNVPWHALVTNLPIKSPKWRGVKTSEGKIDGSRLEY